MKKVLKEVLMPIEMFPEQKYAQFLKNNPQYKKLSRDKIYSIMVKLTLQFELSDE